MNYYDKALKIDPTFTLVWQNKGIVYDKLKNYTEAIKAYDKALSIDPTSTIAIGNKKLALEQLTKNQTSNKP